MDINRRPLFQEVFIVFIHFNYVDMTHSSPALPLKYLINTPPLTTGTPPDTPNFIKRLVCLIIRILGVEHTCSLWHESPPFSVNIDPISDPYGSGASVTIPTISAHMYNAKYTTLSAKSESLSPNGLASEQQETA